MTTSAPFRRSPYSLEAERAVLGCMLAQPTEVVTSAISALSKEDFFVPAHQEIFAVFSGMYEAGVPIDSVVAHQWLADRKLAEAVGSPGIFSELLVGFANHLNVGSYIRIVKEKGLLRRLLSVCSGIVQDVHEMPDSGASVLDRAEAAFHTITKAADRYSLTPREWSDGSNEEIPEPPVLVEGLLHLGSKLILGGSSKSNKTWALLDLALSIAAGGLGGAFLPLKGQWYTLISNCKNGPSKSAYKPLWMLAV